MAANEELVLLERVFLRIGSADTDDQFEECIRKFLAPILLKLSSPVDGVRKKVMELLVHVNKRLKSRARIQLPMDDLFLQYLDENVSSFVTNFTMLYLKMGFPRLEMSRQAELVPQLLKCLEGRPEPQQNSFLQLIMPTMPYIKPPSDKTEKVAMYGLSDQANLRAKLLQHMMDFLLLPYNYGVYQERAKASQPPQVPTSSGPATSATSANTPGASSTPSTPATTPEQTFNGPPPALSESAFKRVLGEAPPSPEHIEKIKHGIVQFLAAEIYPKSEILVHLLVATADTRYSVATAADRELKLTVDSEDWNSPAIMNSLYTVFQGTVAVKGKKMNMRSEEKRTPASIQLRLKIFPYLLKSREAANQFPACVQIVFDCLYGANTNTKLKTMSVQFIHHLCLHEATFRPMGAVLLSGMIKLIGEAKEDSKLRMLAYIAVGKIGRRLPQLVTRDMSLLQNFFDAISEEAGDNRLAIQEAMSMMSEAFKGVDHANAKLVEALIMQNIDKPESQARQMAVEYAKTVFEPEHIPSRYVLLLACGDSKDEIAGEAAKALRAPLLVEQETSQILQPKRLCTEKRRPLPPFVDMIKYIQEMGAQRVKTQHKYVTGNHILPFTPGAYSQILLYLRMCLAHDAGADPSVESVADMKAQAPAVGVYIRRLIGDEKDVEKSPIAPYIHIIRQLLTAVGGEVPMYCLMEMVAMVGDKLASLFVKNLDWIQKFMFSSREEVRVPAAELYALVIVATMDEKQRREAINQLCDNISKQALEGQHGSILCLGHVIGLILANRKPKAGQLIIEDMETDEVKEESGSSKALNTAINAIVEMLESSHTLLSHGACVSLGEMGRNGALPILDQSENEKSVTKLSIVKRLLTMIKSGKLHNKVKEEAATCAGYMCVGDQEYPHRQVILDGLLDSAAAKQFELHFTIGDALVCCALGVMSPEGRDVWSVTEDMYKPTQVDTDDKVPDLLQVLLHKYSSSPNRHIRQAACIWLLTLTKKCSKHVVIQGALMNIQQTFMNFLSENDELTQDLASKGLGVVYEVCGQEQKQQLVSMLVDTLTSGAKRKTNVQVTSDTKVFDEGSLGKTPDGQSMTTYKELCSIANDLNQPDLIYKFMHLANHNSIWNSKKGAAFGFSTIAAQAGEQLAPHLHKIIPKLYRYQFDPNSKIHQAMSSIWNALVPKPKDTVDKYLPEILADLQVNLVSNQWRTRESSCLAVNDVLRGRNLDEVVDALPVLWENLFRVRDDIKESVRNTAEIAIRSLSKASIKICDSDYGKVGDKATALILPCLIKGLSSSVKEVQEISLATLIKISKSAGVLLRPHIPMLTVSLLESLSTLENQVLSYVSLHLASSEDSLEKLDSARIAASKSSPMMDTVNLCVQYVDAEVMTELVPRLVDLIKSNVGLATKAGCSNFIVSLCHQCPRVVEPHAGKLLGVLLNGLQDRNTSVRKSYAMVIGNLVKVAKDSSVEKLILKLKGWYLEKEDESGRQVCGTTLHAMNRYSPDILRRHSAVALPLCFLAMQDKQESSVADKKDSVWEEVWLDATPGTEGGIRLYLTELVELSQLALQSQSWRMKAQGALTMAAIADKLQDNLRSPHLGLLLNALLDGLSGRTWTGKEALLKAIGMVCTSCKDGLMISVDGQPTVDHILTTMMKECRKENTKYKCEALMYTTDIIQAHGIDLYKDISDIISPQLAQKAGNEDDDDKKSRWDIQENGYECLGKAWPTDQHLQTQDLYREQFFCTVCDALGSSVWKVELSALKALHTYILRLSAFKCVENIEKNKDFVVGCHNKLLSPLCQCLGKVKYSSIRTTALDITEALYTADNTGAVMVRLLSQEHQDLLKSTLQHMADHDPQPDLSHRATQALKILRI